MDIPSELDRAKAAARTGNLTEARLILKQVIDNNPRSAEAWAMMADLVPKPEHVILCLERVLKLDPGNVAAQRKLAAIKGEQDPVQAEVAPERQPVTASLPATAGDPQEQDSVPHRPFRPAKPSRGSRRMLEFFLIGLVGIFACCVVGLLIIPFDSLLPGNPEAQPASAGEEITAVIYENIRASNAEDIELYMSTIHSKSPAYNDTVQTLSTAFRDYDLSYRISDVEVLSHNQNQAQVAFVLTTRRLRGPSFRDNRVTGEMILRIEDGVWKIYGQTIENIEYLD